MAMCLYKKIIVLVTDSVMVHVSQLCVKAEHRPDAYRLILMFRERRWHYLQKMGL